MKNSRIRLIAGLALATLILSTMLNLPVIGQTGLGSISNAAAQSADQTQANINVYLPMIVGKYPVVSTFGVEMGSITNAGGLQQVSDAGVHWVRKNGLLWSVVQPSEGSSYKWSAVADLENELINAAKENLQVILIVRSTPSWARKSSGSVPTCGPIAEDKFDAFGKFLQAAVERYSQPPFNVNYWELYNEPDKPVQDDDDVYGCWGVPSASNHLYGGDYYGKMLNAVYPYIKAGNPGAQVLNGGLLLGCSPDHPADVCGTDESFNFLQGMLQTGANGIDGISFHSYDYSFPPLGAYSNYSWNSAWDTTGPVLLAKADFIRQVLAQNGISGKYLVNTESALIKKGTNVCDFACEQNKAYYVSQLYAAGIKADLRMNVWYSIRSGWENTDLLAAGNNPLPAYNAYQFVSSELGDAQFVKSLDYPGVMGYELTRGGLRIWVMWSTAEASDVVVTLPGTPSGVWTWDTTSNQYVAGTPAASITVGRAPLYLEWNP